MASSAMMWARAMDGILKEDDEILEKQLKQMTVEEIQTLAVDARALADYACDYLARPRPILNPNLPKPQPRPGPPPRPRGLDPLFASHLQEALNRRR